MVPDEQLAMIEQRVNELSTDMRDMKAIVYGDTARRMAGLLEQFDAMREEFKSLRADLGELLTWRREMTLLMRIGVGVMTIGGGANIIGIIQSYLGGG